MYQQSIANITINTIDGDPDGKYVFLMHGYGASGKDLVSLRTLLQPDNQPKYNWFFPEAPIDLGMGKAWFHIPEIAFIQQFVDYSDIYPPGMKEARQIIKDVIGEITNDKTNKIIVGGFSQGAMLSTDFFLEHPTNVAGLLIFSGTLVDKKRWSTLATKNSGFCFFQSHGRQDPLLTYQQAEALGVTLTEAGMNRKEYMFDGGHEITMDVMKQAKAYLQELG